jgi:hypothetical protein
LTAGEVKPLSDTLSSNSAKAPGIALFNSSPQKKQRDPWAKNKSNGLAARAQLAARNLG